MTGGPGLTSAGDGEGDGKKARKTGPGPLFLQPGCARVGVGPCKGGQSGHFRASDSSPFSGLQDTFHSEEQRASSPQQTHHPTPRLRRRKQHKGTAGRVVSVRTRLSEACWLPFLFISALFRYSQLLHDIRGEKKICIILCESPGVKIKLRNENPLMPADPPARQTSPPDLSHLPVCPQVPGERDRVAIPVNSKCLQFTNEFTLSVHLGTAQSRCSHRPQDTALPQPGPAG